MKKRGSPFLAGFDEIRNGFKKKKEEIYGSRPRGVGDNLDSRLLQHGHELLLLCELKYPASSSHPAGLGVTAGILGVTVGLIITGHLLCGLFLIYFQLFTSRVIYVYVLGRRVHEYVGWVFGFR